MTYIKQKGNNLNQKNEINNIMNIRNQNDINTLDIQQLLNNPIIQQNPSLLNNIKMDILFKTKNYSNIEIINQTESEMNYYIENHKQDIYRYLNKIHDLPRWISSRNEISTSFIQDFSKQFSNAINRN